jgi:chorismate mutase/prephenate dehydratase
MSNDKSNLKDLRKQIDELDQHLVELLSTRARVVVQIGECKRGDDTPVYAPDREQQVLRRVRDANDGPLPDKCLEAIWREMMSGSFALERSLRIGYLGPPGSYSHLAARRKFGASIDYEAVEDIASVFHGVAGRRLDLGVVPFENSTDGGIGETLDTFLEADVRVYAELLISVRHNLLANCELSQVTKVYSKPPALAQCRQWLTSHLKDAQRIPTVSTSQAAEIAANESGAAAVASTLAGEMYGVHLLEAGIEDNPSNVTRFFVIALHEAKPSGDDKTAILFTTAHKTGALADVLDVFRKNELNLTHIDTRPSRRVNWEYYFFIDVTGHKDTPHVAAALEEAAQHCRRLTVLGSFPRATDVL